MCIFGITHLLDASFATHFSWQILLLYFSINIIQTLMHKQNRSKKNKEYKEIQLIKKWNMCTKSSRVHSLCVTSGKPQIQNIFFVGDLNLEHSVISATFLKLLDLTNQVLCPTTTAFLKRFLVLSDSGWTRNTTKTTFLMVFWHFDHQDQMAHRSAEEALDMNNDTLLKIIHSSLTSLNIRKRFLPICTLL